MKKSQLKVLIREILKEIYHSKGINISETYDDYEIEFESLAIPGISTEDDTVYVSMSINYDASSGYESSMYGPPEKSYAGEGPSVEITGYHPVSIRVLNSKGKETEYDPKELTEEQRKILEQAIDEHMVRNESKIEDMILDKVEFSPY
jgi:hypothetical protein